VPEHCDQPFHMFYMLMPNLELRTRFIKHLRERGVYAVFHYLPLHLSDMGRKLGGSEGDFPITERVSDQLVRLPLHNLITGDEQEEVIEAIQNFVF
jgi:dTDP-4-amino-4,6-dideoxygalactose transaminase